jgi:hypothetical protein
MSEEGLSPSSALTATENLGFFPPSLFPPPEHTLSLKLPSHSLPTSPARAHTLRYAFGITLYELATALTPFAGIPATLLGHQISKEGLRPQVGYHL